MSAAFALVACSKTDIDEQLPVSGNPETKADTSDWKLYMILYPTSGTGQSVSWSEISGNYSYYNLFVSTPDRTTVDYHGEERTIYATEGDITPTVEKATVESGSSYPVNYAWASPSTISCQGGFNASTLYFSQNTGGSRSGIVVATYKGKGIGQRFTQKSSGESPEPPIPDGSFSVAGYITFASNHNFYIPEQAVWYPFQIVCPAGMTWHASVINDNYFIISSTAVWPTGTPVTSGGRDPITCSGGRRGKNDRVFLCRIPLQQPYRAG